MKPLTFAVLRLLSDGEFRSGEEMARRLEVSRAGVWQALQGLGGCGVSVFRVPGRGYRLSEPLQWLDADAVYAALGKRAQDFDLEILDRAESTNTLLLKKAELGAKSGSVVAAEWQTHGRGRRGREWHAGLGGALTFSLLWRFSQGAGFLSGLSLAVGVALARALKKLGVGDAALKWPNDLLWRHHKVGGILIEVQGDVLGPSAAVIGVGLNVRLADGIRGRIDQAAADLHAAGAAHSGRSSIFAACLAELAEVLELFAQRGFAPFCAEWQACHAHQGKAVTLIAPDGSELRGVAAGAAEDGALLLRTEAGIRRCHSGEISLRPGARPQK